MPKYLVLVPVLLLALVVGCGGDSAPTKQEFIAQLDKVCKESNAEVQKLRAPKSIKDIPRFVEDSRVVVEASIKQAEDLDLPEDGNGFKEYIADSRRSLSALDDLSKAAAAGDAEEVKRVFDATTKDNEKRDKVAAALGLKQCGNG